MGVYSDLPSLVKVLLSRKGDDHNAVPNRSAASYWWMVSQEDTAALSRQRRMLFVRTKGLVPTEPILLDAFPYARNIKERKLRPDAARDAKTQLGNDNAQGTELLRGAATTRDRADELIEAIPLNEIGGVETKKLMAEMAVKQAVRQLCANWRKRSMQMPRAPRCKAWRCRPHRKAILGV